MKNILVILFILISLISCKNNPNNPNNDFTTGPGNFSKLAGTYVSSILEDGTRLKITIKNDNSPLIINISGKDYEIDTSNVEESTEGKYSIRYSKDVYSEVIISISLLGESTIHFSQWGWSEDLLLRENYILIKENNLNIDSGISKWAGTYTKFNIVNNTLIKEETYTINADGSINIQNHSYNTSQKIEPGFIINADPNKPAYANLLDLSKTIQQISYKYTNGKGELVEYKKVLFISPASGFPSLYVDESSIIN